MDRQDIFRNIFTYGYAVDACFIVNHTDDFIEISIDGLSDGTWNFTLTAQDRGYNHAFDSVIVTVTEAGFNGITIPFEMFMLIVGSIGAIMVVVVVLVAVKRRR